MPHRIRHQHFIVSTWYNTSYPELHVCCVSLDASAGNVASEWKSLVKAVGLYTKMWKTYLYKRSGRTQENGEINGYGFGLVKWTWVCKRIPQKIMLGFCLFFLEIGNLDETCNFRITTFRYTPVRTVLTLIQLMWRIG